MQNRTHINALSNYLKLDKDKMKSYIVFSDRCELKKVPYPTTEYLIVNRNAFLKNLRRELSDRQIIFTPDQVDKIVETLQPLTNATIEVKSKHIENIDNKFKNNY